MKTTRLIGLTVLCACYWAGFASNTFAAPPRYMFEENCDHRDILINTDGSKPTKEQYAEKARRDKQCLEDKARIHKQAITARVTLKKKFNIDASNMNDWDTVYRLNQEEETARINAAEAKEQRRLEDMEKRENQIQSIMKQQQSMMKAMGVDVPSDNDEDKTEQQEDAEQAKIQQQMYQSMVDGGAAPQCKGKTGDALIECVEAAVEQGK